MFFSMYARGSLVILLLVTYILTDEPSNQKRVSSMYVQESLFILLLGTYIHTDQPNMSARIMSTSVSMYVKIGQHTCTLSVLSKHVFQYVCSGKSSHFATCNIHTN